MSLSTLADTHLVFCTMGMSEVAITKNIHLRRRWVFLGWTIIGIFFVGRNIASAVSRSAPINWHRAVIFEFTSWYIWALLTPFIFWYARRFPLTREKSLRNGVALLLFGVFITAFHLTLDYVINLPIAKWIIRVPEEELR